ncbi:MAG: transposase [Chiayiivirga sp.]|nr:transposase [Chiayiivirga sp.]
MANGTTHVEFEPVEFIAKLAALVPPPRAHLTRFHGIFAPNANLRAQLTPRIAAKAAQRPPIARRPHAGRETRRDELGATPQARVRHRRGNGCVHCGGR